MVGSFLRIKFRCCRTGNIRYTNPALVATYRSYLKNNLFDEGDMFIAIEALDSEIAHRHSLYKPTRTKRNTF
jgi:hypothetical protein